MFTQILRKITKNKYYLIGAISIFLLLIVSLGTAALRSTLSIVGNTSVANICWNEIHFDNIQEAADAKVPDITTTYFDSNKTRIDFTVDLKPGELYEFTVDTVNPDCNINVMVDYIEKYQLTEAQKKYIDFEVIYTDEGVEPYHCSPLYKGTSRELKVTVKYKEGLPLSEYPSTDEHLNLFFDIHYVQDGGCTPYSPYTLTIDPNGGYYDGRKVTKEVKLLQNSTIYPDEYIVNIPTRTNYNFKGWKATPIQGNGSYTMTPLTGDDLGKYLFKIGHENVKLEADWEEGDFVARIQNAYFHTIQDAFDAADGVYTDYNGDSHDNPWPNGDNTVHLLRDTTEYATNTTTVPFDFDLESYTVTGRITNNNGKNETTLNNGLTLINGRVEELDDNPNDDIKGAVVNYGILSLGKNDGLVDVENSIAIVGEEIGLFNDRSNGSKFNFYDGFIEGVYTYVRGYDKCPDNYFVFINPIAGTNRKRAYLVNSYTRAVAKTTTDGVVVYYNLQNAFDDVYKIKDENASLTDDDYIVYAIRDFEAAYQINIPEDYRIFFDLDGFRVWTGETVSNAGYFNVYSSSNERAELKPSKVITNTGEMKLNNLNVSTTTSDIHVVSNTGNLDISNTEIHGQHTYAVTNTGSGELIFDQDTFIDSVEHYGLYNTSNKLVVTDGTIYGFLNTASGAKITGGTFKIYQWRTYTSYSYTDHFIPAVDNQGSLTIEDGNFTETTWSTYVVKNKGTINVKGGTFNAIDTVFQNNYDSTNGNLNITGGNITSTNVVVNDGNVTVTNGATISSSNGPTVRYANATVNNGTISTTSGNALYNSNLTIHTGEVVSENGTTIDTDNRYSTTVLGGTVHSLNGAAISGSNVEISAGLIEGTTYGISSGAGVTVTGGKITSPGKAVTCSSINISNGEITSDGDAVTTTNLSITGGKVESTNGTALTVNGNGTILNGKIHGGMYGVLNNGKVTIGTDEGDISDDTPTIVGDSVGVYITGTDTYFFDGILKGQVDGYVGEITRTPLGGTPASGTETINGVLYQTDYIIQFEPWLEVDGATYNTIDDASSAINDGETGTIKVIADVVPSFIQHFKDENHNKNITFDLNGHTLRSTQVAYNNESNVTLVDSVGTGKITNDISNYFENDKVMIVNDITMISSGDKAAIRNYRHGKLTITDANITAHKYGIQNMGTLIITDITLTSEQDGIWAEYIDELYDSAYGNVTMNGGTINAQRYGVFSRGQFNLNDGLVEAKVSGSYGSNGTTINGGRMHSQDSYTIYSGSVDITGGEVVSDSNLAAYTSATINVSGGYVEGTTALSHYAWYDLYSRPNYSNINVSGGKVVGTVNHGIRGVGATVHVTGGEVIGEVDGINSDAVVRLGNNDGSISKTSPVIRGKRYGVNSNKTFEFFDGVIKGITAARLGQVNLVPDASMVIDDFEYINRVEYKIEYLDAYGDWLQVGEQKFNSLYAAQDVIADYGTVYVIKDVNINFEQSLVAGKHVTFDLNGHQVMMLQTLSTKGTNTVTDSSLAKTGLLSNINEDEDEPAITNTGNLTIGAGQYNSLRDYAFTNKGTIIVNDINIQSNGCFENQGYLEINGGIISNTTSSRPPIYNNYGGSSLKVTGGEITSDYTTAIDNDCNLVITGGTITSTVGIGIDSSVYYGSTNISGGTIIGKTHGLRLESNKNSASISGGHIEGQTGDGVYSENNLLTITGGELVGKVYGYETTNGGTVGVNDGTVVIDTPVIRGDNAGVNIQGGTFNFNDGIFKGITASDVGIITNIPAGTQIYTDTEEINNRTYNTKYLIQEKDLVYNVEKEIRYNNLQLAFDDAEEGNHLELLTNIPIYYAITNNNTNSFTLDLKGYSISTNKPIVNNGKLTITDSEDEVGTIKTSSGITLLSNTNELTLNKINLINSGSSNYIVSNSGTLDVNQTIINGINGITSGGTLNINNANITGSNAAVASSGVLSINKGTYASDSNAIYSAGSNTNEVYEANINGRVVNASGTLEIKKSNIVFNTNGNYNLPDDAVENAGTIRLIQNTNITGAGRLSNSGTMYIDSITVDINSDRIRNNPYYGVYNSGTLDIDNSTITIDKNTNRNDARGFGNVGNLTVHNNVTVEIGSHDPESYGTHYGFVTSNNGKTLIDGAIINVHGMNTVYAFHVSGGNALTTIKTGSINVTDSKYAYGAYTTSNGTFVMGESDDIEDESDLVSQSNPRIYVVGSVRGTGVKKVGGNFNFFDGLIRASTHAKPETTTRVQHLYEVSTYVDENTGLEFALLEFMGNDYDQTTVAKIGQTSYYSLQRAIDAYDKSTGEEIILVRSVEENIEIRAGMDVVIDLHGMSLTASIENNGKLQLHNGTVIEVSNPEDATLNNHINNYGTLILGKDDGVVSSTSMRIISENLAINSIYEDQYIHNEGTIEMYDGYIEGNPALNTEINKIADFARLYTKNNAQYERIYLQSLSEDAIRNKETALILSINPNGGTYKDSSDIQSKFLYYEEEEELAPNPTKHASVFDGWEINDPTALIYDDVNGIYKIKVGLRDIEVKAKWIIDENAVAKIGEKYYFSLQEANDDASNGDVIEVIKNITLGENESTTITKNVTIDLGGFTYNGPIINNGELTIYHGTINNSNGTGIVNNRVLTMGINDGNVELDSVRVFGSEVGIEQNGRFNYYDGNIEGVVAMNGAVSSLPQGFHLYTESIDTNNPPTQKAILTGNPANAVAIIRGDTTDLDQYFFKLTDAIASAALSNKEIDIIKNFTATYPVTIKEEYNIVINMNSYDITTGNTFDVNGTLKLYDKSENKGSITFAQTINNNGVLNVEDITLIMNQDRNLLTNKGILNLTGATLQASSGYAVSHQSGEIIMDSNSLLTANSYGLYNGTELTLTSGKVKGIVNRSKLTLNNVTINQTASGYACVDTNSNTQLTIDGGSCTSAGPGIYTANSNLSINIDHYTITASNYSGININRNSANELEGVLNINNSTITGSTGIHVNSSINNWKRYVTIKNSTITGSGYGLNLQYSSTNIQDSTIISTSSSSYAIYVYNAWLTFGRGAKIESDTSNGINLNNYGQLSLAAGSSIKLTRSDAKGIYMNSSQPYLEVLNGSKIEVTASSSYGVLNEASGSTTTISGGEIISANVGIRNRSYVNGSSINDLNVYGGSITGGNYGVYLYSSSGTVTMNVGKNADDLDQNSPYITGGFYGIYREAGNINFYNGRIRGYVDACNVDYNTLKTAHDLAIYEEIPHEYDDISTYSTTNVSAEPVADYAKQNNGYAKITYIGETTSECTNGDSQSFDYTGTEETYTATCAGEYKLETWGAQGGSLTSPRTITGGYGGYSTGNITLTAGETLYINVGGQGTGSTTGKDRIATGGYNGGGDGYTSTSSSNRYATGGGGATHIATRSGLLKELENHKSDIIMVAGGGAGVHYISNYYHTTTAGSGGGYLGGYGTANHNTTGSANVGQAGATQTSGYAFGQGGLLDTPGEHGSGGGGYYGGSVNGYADGGGSGYIANSRLHDKYMYGYNVTYTPHIFTHNYLVEKEHFVQVNDGTTFNSITSAANYIKNNLDGTGKMTLIANATLQEVSELPSGTTLELDLNGKTLKSNQSINNNNKLTITDSSTDHSGVLENTRTTTINNYGTLTIEENVTLKSVATVVYSTHGTTVTQKAGSKIIGDTGYSFANKVTVDITNAEITTTGDGIYYNNTSGSNTGGVVNITNSTIISSGAYGIETYNNVNSWNRTINITDSTIKGASHAIVGRYSVNNITNSLVVSTGSEYSIYLDCAQVNMRSGAKIESDTANGIYLAYNSQAYLYDGSSIKLTRNDAVGIYFTNQNDGVASLAAGSKIEVPGSSSFGIKNEGLRRDLTINGEVRSGNVGIRHRSHNNGNGSSSVSVVTGTIVGGNYGIYVYDTDNGPSPINLGRDADPLSQQVPYISGGQYGLYKEVGTVNFYNGRLRGTEAAYNSTFNQLKRAMKVVDAEEHEDPLDDTSTLYHVKYLESLEPFARTEDGQEFSSLTDAVNHIVDTQYEVGKITITRNAEIQETTTIASETEITIDLNGKTFKSNQPINNNATLKVIDSSSDHSGVLENTRTTTINNYGTLTVDENVTIKSIATVVYSTHGTTINQKSGSKIIGETGYSLLGKVILNVTGAEINTSGDGIYYNSNSGSQKGGVVTVTNSTITSSGGCGINTYNNVNDWNRTVNVTGSTITTASHALVGRYSVVNVENSLLHTTGTAYTIYLDCGQANLRSGAKIESDTANGIYVAYNAQANLNAGSSIVLNRNDARGVYFTNQNDGYFSMAAGSKIEVPGSSAYGILNDGYRRSITINGGEITSGNVGIRSRSQSNNSGSNTFNIYSGNIVGGNYGVYIFDEGNGTSTVNIGKNADALDQQIPYIEGGLYGIYKETGSINFYNGRLKGITYPYNGEFANVKDNHQVYLTNEDLTDAQEGIRTYAVTAYSADPTPYTSKKGDGYAKINYITSNPQAINFDYVDEIVNENEDFYYEDFSYTGSESTFTVPEEGDYVIETWGAQGGGSVGGVGAYSKGQVHLQKNEVLYINVGGRAQGGTGGYNGGGSNGSYYGGGGASHVATKSGLLSTLSSSRDDILIVAGGGGGMSDEAGYVFAGGAGGGIRGNSGSGHAPGSGGTQTSTGSAGSLCNTYASPGFGKGGSCTWGANEPLGAGGGGFYGGGSAGGSSYNGGGGGGSGYIGNSRLTEKHMYCYNCTTSDDVSTKTISGGGDSCSSEEPTADCAKEGNGHIKITKISGTLYDVDEEFNYTGNVQSYNVEYNGVYKLEVWGAQGGSYSDEYHGGYGGYSTGLYEASRGDIFYIAVGGAGQFIGSYNTAEGGYNGGGALKLRHSDGNERRSTGGGATHIALNNNLGELKNYVDNKDDVLIVAGGGGGGQANYVMINSSYYTGGFGYGGSGGGTNGGLSHGQQYNDLLTAAGGTQEGPAYHASFGVGGDIEGDSNASGGGGGWYGGQGFYRGGGGGSGHLSDSIINGHMACYDCMTTEDGITTNVTDISEDALEDTAKKNNGYAKITLVSTNDSLKRTITFHYDRGDMEYTTKKYITGEKLGELPVPTNIGNYYFDGWYLDNSYTKKVYKNTVVRGSADLYAKFVALNEFCDNSYSFEFDYTGSEQVFTAPCTGKYTLETWGAQGGSVDGTNVGGYGAYSVGSINLTVNDTLYINVGGKGSFSNDGVISGGYNGGGSATGGYCSGTYRTSGSGGGATHIATRTGLLSSLENNKSDILIVAGGGGGAYTYGAYGPGGSGGGYIGGTGNYTLNGHSINFPATGGNQTQGGRKGNSYQSQETVIVGSFGQGANHIHNACSEGAGGGGGFYGGGDGFFTPGGGGSGYIANTNLYDKAMYGYNVSTKYNADSATIAYLIPTVDFIRNKTINQSYSSITDAFAVASDGDEFELLGNASITMASTIADVRVSLDLAGYDLYTIKTITNNGDLTIFNSDNSKSPKIYSNFSINILNNTNKLTIEGIELQGYNTIVSTGSLVLDGVIINSTNNAVNTSRSAEITDSNIKGSNYAYYESGTTNSTITNTNITGTIQHESSGGITISNSKITGTVNNSAGVMNISGQPISGTISNASTMNIGGITISATHNANATYRMITNSGTLTLSNNTLTTINNYSTTSNDVDNVYNTGTLNSSGNTYNVSSANGKYKYTIPMENGGGILTSTNDIANISNGYNAAAVYNSSDGTSTITNLTSTVQGSTNVYVYNNRSGSTTINGGTSTVTSSTNAYGIVNAGGTITANGLTSNITGADTGAGVSIESGTANIETGSYTITGKTVYGVKISSATSVLNLGVSGVPVDTANPFISAVGSTKGIGVSMGNGTFNYYDGKITANTSTLDNNNIPSFTEPNYHMVDHQADASNPYPYCVLEIYY